MVRKVKLAVMGAGLIGKRHIEHIIASPEAELSAIVDPSPAAGDLASRSGARWFSSFREMLEAQRPEGIVVATPNQMHVEHGMDAIQAGIPALIEKPIADDVASGLRLVEAAEGTGVDLLVGHHRRHNPIIQAAREIVVSGRLGRIVAVHGFFWLTKPAEYFDVSWRRMQGAGPVLLNLIHDIDLLRYLCGEIEVVQAMTSNENRGNTVEDSGVILLKFASGSLGTITVSDTIVAPWSWEQTTGENPAYPHTDQSCYHIGGTHGSLTLPKLEIWSNADKRSWWEPIRAERIYAAYEDPLQLQIGQFCRVIRGEERPLVPGREGLKTLKVVAAVQEAARRGAAVRVV